MDDGTGKQVWFLSLWNLGEPIEREDLEGSFSTQGHGELAVRAPERKKDQPLKTLGQWFSTLLMLQPFNTVPHAVVIPPHHKIIFVATS